VTTLQTTGYRHSGNRTAHPTAELVNSFASPNTGFGHLRRPHAA
jgi:hypothetical protein